MVLSQADLFYGVNHLFLKDVMAMAGRESLDAGIVLFREGAPAEHFFILIDGCVQLSIQENRRAVYVCSKTGEMFGWSSLIGGDRYSASAVGTDPTHFLRIRSRDFLRLLDKDPDSKLTIYQHLAQILGNRLIESYKVIST
jgi:CRP/FNR family transcriptional regulator, cyclic AMP receptor protein